MSVSSQHTSADFYGFGGELLCPAEALTTDRNQCQHPAHKGSIKRELGFSCMSCFEESLVSGICEGPCHLDIHYRMATLKQGATPEVHAANRHRLSRKERATDIRDGPLKGQQEKEAMMHHLPPCPSKTAKNTQVASI